MACHTLGSRAHALPPACAYTRTADHVLTHTCTLVCVHVADHSHTHEQVKIPRELDEDGEPLLEDPHDLPGND